MNNYVQFSLELSICNIVLRKYSLIFYIIVVQCQEKLYRKEKIKLKFCGNKIKILWVQNFVRSTSKLRSCSKDVFFGWIEVSPLEKYVWFNFVHQTCTIICVETKSLTSAYKYLQKSNYILCTCLVKCRSITYHILILCSYKYKCLKILIKHMVKS